MKPPEAALRAMPPPLPPGVKIGNFSNSVGHAQLYGALLDQRLIAHAAEVDRLRAKRRLNCVPLFISLLLPWLAFLASFGLVSFYMHYAAPISTFGFVFVLAGLCFAFAASAWKSWKAGKDEWFFQAYLAFALSVAVSIGAICGDLSFWNFMYPVYEGAHLATYSNVDPSSHRLWSGEVQPTHGKEFQDAGTVYFNRHAVLDQNKSMSFKMGLLYCVAPIVNPDCRSNCGYDFWAVGINCCSEYAANFRCGEYANPHAKSGLRLMDENQRAFFRLAVLEAEGTHHIRSPHPIFVYWLQDPVAESQMLTRQAYKRFILAMFASFSANAIALGMFVSGCRWRVARV